MTSLQYADGLYKKSCKVADVYGDLTLIAISIKAVDLSIYHSLQKYRATHPQADETNIASKMQWVLSIK